MALNNKEKPWFANVPNNGTYRFTDASAVATMGVITNLQTLITAGASGSIVDSITINSTSAAAEDVFFAIIGADGTTVKPLYVVGVPIGSGNTSAAPTVDGLSSTYAFAMPIDGNGKRYIRLMVDEVLAVGLTSTLASGLFLNVTALGADYEA